MSVEREKEKKTVHIVCHVVVPAQFHESLAKIQIEGRKKFKKFCPVQQLICPLISSPGLLSPVVAVVYRRLTRPLPRAPPPQNTLPNPSVHHPHLLPPSVARLVRSYPPKVGTPGATKSARYTSSVWASPPCRGQLSLTRDQSVVSRSIVIKPRSTRIANV
ncbi:hypothetical protein LZ30DRAFT_744026 [Colletotrichum cereale]|nr:hypothetical protein LZ30DRAFT_744026 [Colletotrichum cereale]